MPFDQNGIWHDEITHEPQTGALAGLQILNQPQSYENYQRGRAEQLLGQILGLRSQAGSDIAGTPMGAGAMQQLGISPQGIQQLYSQTPEAQFRSQIGGISSPTMEDVERIGLQTGALTPQQSMGSFRQGMRTGEQEQKDAMTALNNAWKANINSSSSPSEAASRTKAQMMMFPYFQGKGPLLDQWIEAQPESMGGVARARQEEMMARAAQARARAAFIRDTEPSTINVQNATAYAREAAGHAATLRAEVDAARIDGTLPELIPKYMNEVIKLKALGLHARTEAAKAVIPGAGAPAMAYGKLIDADTDFAENLMMMQIAGMGVKGYQPAAAPPAGGKPGAAPADYGKAPDNAEEGKTGTIKVGGKLVKVKVHNGRLVPAPEEAAAKP